MGNYIKIDRKILEWEWYKNEHTKNLFFHCLLKANWKEGKFEGKVIQRGSFVTSIKKLSTELGITGDEIRTALAHLVKTGEITKQTTNKSTVITVSNYELYQNDTKQIPDKSQTDTKQIPDKSQTDTKQIPDKSQTNPNNRRKENREKRKNIYTCAFEEFWKVYPRKRDKGNAFKKFNARLNSGFSEVELIEAAKKYADECARNHTEERYIKHPSTFLSDSTPFVDYLEKNDRGGDGTGCDGRNDKPNINDPYADEFERLLNGQ